MEVHHNNMMASLEELLAKLKEIMARRRATNIHPESASTDSLEVTANDGSEVTEEAADDGMAVVNGAGVNDAAATPNIITAEQQITNDKALSSAKMRSQSPPTAASVRSTATPTPTPIVVAASKTSLVKSQEPEASIEDPLVKIGRFNWRYKKKKRPGDGSNLEMQKGRERLTITGGEANKNLELRQEHKKDNARSPSRVVEQGAAATKAGGDHVTTPSITPGLPEETTDEGASAAEGAVIDEAAVPL
ncbi:unnamed protein product [Linum trigynum]|uniref:Uncharacterized protein n=1 Tax=Linum trigynum TaxID=586398 RepID=A0AAV2DU31_9ROSI